MSGFDKAKEAESAGVVARMRIKSESSEAGGV